MSRLVSDAVYKLDPRFWDQMCVMSTGCWEPTTKAQTRLGYRVIRRRGYTLYAHRYAWSLYYGPPWASDQICHKCDNSACCCPVHLFKGSASDNMIDSAKKGRGGSQRILPDDVARIRELYATGQFTQQELASIYEVSQSEISLITNRLRFGYI